MDAFIERTRRPPGQRAISIAKLEVLLAASPDASYAELGKRLADLDGRKMPYRGDSIAHALRRWDKRKQK